MDSFIDSFTEKLVTQVSVAALARFEAELLANAKKNWLPSQVKMLKALINCTLSGTDYPEEYEKIQSEMLKGLENETD